MIWIHSKDGVKLKLPNVELAFHRMFIYFVSEKERDVVWKSSACDSGMESSLRLWAPGTTTGVEHGRNPGSVCTFLTSAVIQCGLGETSQTSLCQQTAASSFQLLETATVETPLPLPSLTPHIHSIRKSGLTFRIHPESAFPTPSGAPHCSEPPHPPVWIIAIASPGGSESWGIKGQEPWMLYFEIHLSLAPRSPPTISHWHSRDTTGEPVWEMGTHLSADFS